MRRHKANQKLLIYNKLSSHLSVQAYTFKREAPVYIDTLSNFTQQNHRKTHLHLSPKYAQDNS